MTTTDAFDAFIEAIAERVAARIQARAPEAAPLLSVPEAARRLGIRRTKMHGMIQSGEFPQKAIRRIGRRVLVVAAEMDRWVAAQ